MSSRTKHGDLTLLFVKHSHDVLPAGTGGWMRRRLGDLFALVLLAVIAALWALLYTYSPDDRSWSTGSGGTIHNVFGKFGSYPADVLIQIFGGVAYLIPLIFLGWLWRILLRQSLAPFFLRAAAALAGLFLLCVVVAPFPPWQGAPFSGPLGGGVADLLNSKLSELIMVEPSLISLLAVLPTAMILVYGAALQWRELVAMISLPLGLFGGRRRAPRLETPIEPEEIETATQRQDLDRTWAGPSDSSPPEPTSSGRLRIEVPPAMAGQAARAETRESILRKSREELAAEAPSPTPPKNNCRAFALWPGRSAKDGRREPSLGRGKVPAVPKEPSFFKARIEPDDNTPITVTLPGYSESAAKSPAPKTVAAKPLQQVLDQPRHGEYHPPSLDFMVRGTPNAGPSLESQDALEKNARLLEGVLEDFGVRGEIVTVRPGPVVTRYELEPAPGTKTSRVVGLADDIARSMSAISVRVAVVPGSTVIGIELPNAKRQTVYLSNILADKAYSQTKHRLALILGQDIGGAPQVVDLARMPHLLVAGTTGSGKSVAINAMIMSLLYRLSPQQCRLIMVDPKMLELAVYDGIPHLLSPVVTDPKKAVVALKWAVREMEDRYRAMSHLGVRNIDGYNERLRQALDKGEMLTRRIQTGFDPDTGEPVIEQQPLDLKPLPYIVVIVDEMADLMLVAGKEIEGAVQRLAQMARAAGIHMIMATQRPSVDVITGTIKANFPTRISFNVTSKIDSRTILGEMGAEQLLGQGDMLYMGSGGRIQRIHGPFVSDFEVEKVVEHLRRQGPSDYVTDVTEEPGEALAGGNSGDDLYDRAVAMVREHKKASTSFVQRHLQIGYNRAARLVERMESEGVVTAANHVGKREVIGVD